ncbi:MAG: hypothetical protein IJO57_04980, partial [Bacilli bacterium]|nr:hypothetical protein [Bacilli bacterium]
LYIHYIKYLRKLYKCQKIKFSFNKKNTFIYSNSYGGFFMFDNEIKIIENQDKVPLDYRLLEWRLMINRELYEEKIIDLKIYSEIENRILGKMKQIKINER